MAASRWRIASDPMHCVVYKAVRKPDTYLFVEHEDDFGRVPEPLLHMLAPLQAVMTLELGDGRRLARAEVSEVRRLLRHQGYYLQLPPGPGGPQPR